jgi:transposase
MELTLKQYNKIKDYFPVQRGNVKTDNRVMVNALLYLLENGCKWRALPKSFGNWATIYKRLNRWCKAGVLKTIFEELQRQHIMGIEVKFAALDSTCFKVHPDACGALKKTANNQSEKQEADGIPNFIWYPQMIKLPLD